MNRKRSLATGRAPRKFWRPPAWEAASAHLACNRLHPIEARCARWLLLTHDRVDGDSFTLTHEFLAQMLGVTRPSVTIAAGILQKAGLISYLRGVVEIVDRERLEQASCECYGLITEEFERLVGAC